MNAVAIPQIAKGGPAMPAPARRRRALAVPLLATLLALGGCALQSSAADTRDGPLRIGFVNGGDTLFHTCLQRAVPAVGTMAYYKAVQRAMGGSARTEDFARLFLLPGVAHCGGGQGPDSLDALTAVVDWVTRGKAPASLLTRSLDSGGKVTASRPAYPFPYVAKNTTGGPADEAGSYTPVLSAAEEHLSLDWLGSFRSGYETVGNWVHGRWVVSKGKV